MGLLGLFVEMPVHRATQPRHLAVLLYHEHTDTNTLKREGDLFPSPAYPGVMIAILCLIILPYLCRQILGPTQAFNGWLHGCLPLGPL